MTGEALTLLREQGGGAAQVGEHVFFALSPYAMVAAWVLLLGLALLGKPLFAVLAGVAILMHMGHGLQLELVFAEVATIVDQPVFVTIPLFVLAGTLLAESQAPRRLVDLARALLGWLPGGLAIVATVTCAFFTAVTGASGVTIVALGGLLYPALIRERYPERFSVGLITTGGSLGLLFVPSLPIIVYGLIAGVDVDTLFLAGLVPGLLLVFVISGYAVFVGARARVPKQAPPWRAPRTALVALRGAMWELPLPLVIIGGIYSGSVTAIEASAIAALYCLFVEVVVYRDIRPRELPRVCRRTAELVGAILLILAMAMGVKNVLIDAEVPQRLLLAMSTGITSKFAFLVVLNVFLLVTGCLLDIFSAILVVVPLVAPLAIQFGVDPVHLGIIFLTNLEIGYLTPPVGINLFLGSLRFKRSIVWVAISVLPFLLLLALCLAAITYIPWLSTFAVDLARGAPVATPLDETRPDGSRIRGERWFSRDGRALLHGGYEAFYPSGVRREEGIYRYDLPHTIDAEEPRPWVTYRADGTRATEGHYRFGRRHDAWTTWHESGEVKERGTYVDGKKHGYWREWTEDGGKFAEGAFEQDLQHGSWIDWLDDERKLFEGGYRRGKPDGRWKRWDEDTGERLPDMLWQDGVELGEAPPEE